MLSNNKFICSKNFLILIVFAILLFIFCSGQQSSKPKETILAGVGDKTISLNEYLRRAEYTIRPPYCRRNHNLDKKIIINSLIAEKLLSIEAGDSNAFIALEKMQRYLRGRREQSMRQWLYNEEAVKKATIDTAGILEILELAGRKYEISYLNLPDSTLVEEMRAQIKEGLSFEQVCYNLTGLDSLPQRQVEWSENEHDRLLDSLFAAPLQKNQVVGPVRIADDRFIIMQINGWMDRPPCYH